MSISLQEATIIVVEDDPNAQLITLDLLRMDGVTQCYARKTVSSAIAFAERLPQVDIFLADINMPGESGYDLLQLVRQHEKLKQAKVVAVTAGTLDEDVRKVRELGFDGFIGKPIKPASFAQQVQDILDGKSVWHWR
ncbi:MAG: response regulator [Ardenticatenaceae bacterium]|nr:response regulator [Ardenticatenaceae bacterium]